MTWHESDETRPPPPTPAQVGIGWDVFTRDGQRVGNVAAVYGSYFTVARGSLFAADRHFPFDMISGIDADGVHLDLTRDQAAERQWGAAPQSGESANRPGAPRGEAADRTMEMQGAALPGEGERPVAGSGERVLELREERLEPRTELREVGDAVIRVETEEVPGRLEVDVYQEGVEVEHVPVGEAVNERVPPWEEDGVLVVPVYEEQLFVAKRLVLKEQLRIRRVGTTERRLYEDRLRRERVVVEDPNRTGLVHERYPNMPEPGPARPEAQPERPQRSEDSVLDSLIKKVFPPEREREGS